MKIAIVHDDLVQFGGAERVLEGICEIFQEAPIFTSVFDSENPELQKRFGNKDVKTSFLQKIPGWKSLYKAMLPLYGIAFEQFNFDEFDIVISHTTRFAKSKITKPETKHICYCHTPPRFLWHFSGEKSYGILEFLMTKLRIYDRVASTRVDEFIAGSENARKRIEKIYRRDAVVVYPYVEMNRFSSKARPAFGWESWDGGYFVVIARLNKYQRVDLAIKACLELGLELKVVGTGPEGDRLREIKGDSGDLGKVEFLGNLNDGQVVQVLAGCKALIVPGVEDFGLTPLEAQALGKPVVAFKAGGALETVIENHTGIFVEEQTVKSLKKALSSNELKHWKRQDECKDNAKKFSKENFKKEFLPHLPFGT